MDSLSREQYDAHCRALSQLPLEKAIWDPRYVLVFNCLRLLVPADRDFEPFGTGNGQLRIALEALLDSHDNTLSQVQPPLRPPEGGELSSVGDTVRIEPVLGAVVVPKNELMSAGGFRLIGMLGQGGLGTVFLAEPLKIPGRPKLALKILKHSTLTDHTLGVQLAILEAQVGFGLQEQNLVQVFSCGETLKHGPYIAMEYVEGLSLKKWLQLNGKLGGRRAAEAVLVIARAAQAAYAGKKQIVHRDIKPANVLGCVPIDGSLGTLDLTRLKLGDFGVALYADVDSVPMNALNLSCGMSVCGTLGYMAPEQIDIDPTHLVGASADVFALCMTLIEADIGTNPFSLAQVRQLDDMRKALLRQPALTEMEVDTIRSSYLELMDPERLTAKVRDPYLRSICMRGLAPNPADRYADAGALSDELKLRLDDRISVRSSHLYSRGDRRRLFWNRCKRPEPEFDADKATLWSIGFVFLALLNFVLTMVAAILISGGGNARVVNAWAGTGALLCFIIVGSMLVLMTRNLRIVGWMYGCIGVLIVCNTLIQHIIIPDDVGTQVPVMLLLCACMYATVGLSDARWRLATWVGLGLMIATVPAAIVFRNPAAAPWGAVAVGIAYNLFLVVLAAGHLWPILRSGKVRYNPEHSTTNG